MFSGDRLIVSAYHNLVTFKRPCQGMSEKFLVNFQITLWTNGPIWFLECSYTQEAYAVLTRGHGLFKNLRNFPVTFLTFSGFVIIWLFITMQSLTKVQLSHWEHYTLSTPLHYSFKAPFSNHAKFTKLFGVLFMHVYHSSKLCISCANHNNILVIWQIFRAGNGMVCHTGTSLASSKPYHHFFSEKHHIGMSHVQHVSQCTLDYLNSSAMALSQGV